MYAEPWTTRELEVMRERSYLGAAAVQRTILAECGTERTIRSIESHASRYHMSLKVRHVCPECGVVGIRLNRQSGLCPARTERLHLAEVASIRRERDRMRKRNSRLCKKYGLKTRRELRRTEKIRKVADQAISLVGHLLKIDAVVIFLD